MSVSKNMAIRLKARLYKSLSKIETEINECTERRDKLTNLKIQANALIFECDKFIEIQTLSE